MSASLAEMPASRRFAIAAAELAANTRCERVVVLDLRGKSPVAEYFVIATGTSPRQMRTVVDEVQDLGKQMDFAAWQTSGYESARWILVDCVNVVVHVFDPDSRDFYDLELLWGDCPKVDWRGILGWPAESLEERMRPAAAGGGQSREEDEEDESELDDDADSAGEGDADIDEEAEAGAPVEVEVADEGEGGEGVEFVEVTSPGRRRKKEVLPALIPEESAEDELAPAGESALGEGIAAAADAEEDEEGATRRRPGKAGGARRASAKKAARKAVRKVPAKKAGAGRSARKAAGKAAAKKPVGKAAAKKPVGKAAAKKPVRKAAAKKPVRKAGRKAGKKSGAKTRAGKVAKSKPGKAAPKGGKKRK